MRLAVLASPQSWYVADLQRAGLGQHEVTALPFTQLASSVEQSVAVQSGPQALEEFDAVLVRTMPPGSLEQVVFRMDALQQLAGQLPVINPPKAIEAAVDKYLSLCQLRAAGFRVPRTFVCQTVEEALTGFHRLGEDVVLKPVFGSEGRGITRLNDEAMADRAFRLLVQLGAVIYLQEFVPHEGVDLRLLVIGDKVWGMRRKNPLDWRTNVSRGAQSEPAEVSLELAELAQHAANAVGAPLAGIDVLPQAEGEPILIEVNAVPGWRALARTLQTDIAAEVLEFMAMRVAAEQLAQPGG